MADIFKEKPKGVTMGWNGEPMLCFESGQILWSKEVESILYPEYQRNENNWPIDPDTKEPLPIYF